MRCPDAFDRSAKPTLNVPGTVLVPVLVSTSFRYSIKLFTLDAANTATATMMVADDDDEGGGLIQRITG